MRPCFTKEACLGGVALSPEVFCAPSQRGPYCAACSEAHFGGGDGALCSPCEGAPVLTFLPAIIVLVVALGVIIHLVRKCIRGDEVTEQLSSLGATFAQALEGELTDADATSTFGVLEGVAKKLADQTTDLTQEKIDLIRDKALEQLTKQLNKEIESSGALNKKKQAKMDPVDIHYVKEGLGQQVHHTNQNPSTFGKWNHTSIP